MDNNDRHNSRGSASSIIIGAVALVVLASFLPWEELTGGKVKDFNLFSDLKTEIKSIEEEDSVVGEYIEEIAVDSPALIAETPVASEKVHSDTTEARVVQEQIPERQPSRVGEMTVIEDYSADKSGLRNIRDALAEGRTVHIAVVGDSYIEGDIMTQDLRAYLQSAYGGNGVGYMNMHSDFPGFRQSVTQSGKGWKCFTATKRGKECYMGLSEQYAVAEGSAIAEYKGVSRIPHASSWDRSLFMFIAPEGGEVYTSTGAGEWQSHEVNPSEAVQAIEVDTTVTRFGVKVMSPSVISLGVWLESSGRGISLDCMSSRGIPGYSLSKVPVELSRQMSHWVDYDLIIIEFGINVLSAKQKNYSKFGQNMQDVINHLRACYPSARILVMGIGDRGEKREGKVRSMSTIPAMINVQRDAARATGALFWDTRDAMGGEDAIVEWTRNGWTNKDYIHLSHKGGKVLAEKFGNALKQLIDQ